MPEIIFYHSTICPRCFKPRKLLKELERDYPNLSIKRVGAITRFLGRKLRTLPAVQIGETILYGNEISKERVLQELSKESDSNNETSVTEI